MHGAKGGRPITHGMYSTKVNTKLEDLYAEFMEDTDSINALNNDIALMRAMMINALPSDSDIENDTFTKNDQVNTFLRFMRDIRYAIELKDDIESKYMVPVETVQIFLNQLLFILKKRIKDDDLLETIMADLRNVKLLDQDTNQPKKLREFKKRR